MELKVIVRSEEEIHQIVHKVLDQYSELLNGNLTATGNPQKSEAIPLGINNSTQKKVIVIGADHGGFELKEILKPDIAALGFDIIDVGTNSKESVDYPDFAHEVAKLVSTGKAWRGIVIDGAGIGSCIVANKVPGIRAGMAYDYSSAVNSREHNDTNILTLGAGLIGINLARQIVKVWLTTNFGGERHQRRVDKIMEVEKQYSK